MKKLTALLLIICMVFTLLSCGKKAGDSTGENTPTTDGGSAGNNENISSGLTVVVPEYKDYGRGTENFDKLVYSRPNMQAVIDGFGAATYVVEADEIGVDEQIAKIREMEEPLATVKTMYSLAQIYNNKNSSVEYWQTEYGYISANYPKLSQIVEDLLVACAQSEHRATFETEYFGYSLEEYVDGGIYSDEVVALMEEEARLESEYTSISTATVEITYKGTSSNMQWSGTVDSVIAQAQEYFKYDEASFERCLLAIDVLYESARQKIEGPLLIELIRVRRLIADELGLESYSELAYDSMGYDYSSGEMLSLLDDIGQYVAPVASDLEYSVFQSYFTTNVQPRLDKTVLINTLYQIYDKLGGDYKDAYSYMLQHGLYDVDTASANRYNGAFTAYIDNNNSPYIFMTATGFIRDYTTLSHEFGHFLDGYVNNGVDASLSVSEISSQALELLTLTRLKNNIPALNYSYLEYYTMFTYLNDILLVQSFYSTFEHMVYQLEYEDITENKIIKTIEDAFSKVFGDGMTIDGDLSYVTIAHVFLYPFYVESYVTAGIVSLDIYFKEVYGETNAREGFALYEALIRRGGNDLSFIEQLDDAGLDSPFSFGKVKEIADSIYFRVVGKHYYKNSDTMIDAA